MLRAELGFRSPTWSWAFLLALGACSEGPAANSSPEPRLSLANVAYGSDPSQIMDLELPAGRTGETPIVVFIHGGGWSAGDKSVFLPIDLEQFVTRGWATANINYRLANGTVHDPVLSHDVTAAMDFLASHAGEYQVASDRFAVVGHSSGAHLALLAAYRYNPNKRIKAVASLAGPTDLTDPVWLSIPGVRSVLENYLGQTQSQAPEQWAQASPFYMASTGAPASILIYGRQDVLVPWWQGDRLAGRLGALAVPVQYHLFHIYNHDLGYATNRHFPNQVLDPVLAWFSDHLK